MANPTIRIFDCETQETIDREMTDDEFAAYEAKIAEQLARIAARDSI
jgi:hypothetical protein